MNVFLLNHLFNKERSLEKYGRLRLGGRGQGYLTEKGKCRNAKMQKCKNSKIQKYKVENWKVEKYNF